MNRVLTYGLYFFAVIALATVGVVSIYTFTTPPQKRIVQRATNSQALSIQVIPAEIQQGDPVLIQIEGFTATSSVRSLTYAGTPLATFTYNGKPAALLGIDLNAKTGSFPLVLTLKDGRQIKAQLTVHKRPKKETSLGIPESLGGNTPQAERALSANLAHDSRLVNALPVTNTKLWDGPFQPPLAAMIVTDEYGYSRNTDGTTISHLGTDYHAPLGTPVYAMNAGIVRYAGFLHSYGNTIVIDHGAGVQTIYMHLSEINVQKGQTVQKGALIGKSGDTGYALGPHLHLSVKIWHVSVEPEKFLQLFGDDAAAASE